MKKIFFLLLPVFLFQSVIFAQCGSATCPPGAINTLPAGGIITAGTTYCISGPVNNTTAYTINGTLIIQSGSVTIGDLTVGKTGSIIVNGGAQLIANSYTGDATAPASTISNVIVCNSGYLYLSGAINPGETNFEVGDYGMFVIHGSWSTIIGDTWFKLGAASIVEMCSSFTFKSGTGFFTETSTSPSYIVTRSAMANGAGGGYLSTLGAASQIKWDISGGPVAWVDHPAANTCTGPSCGPMLPAGALDNGTCGSVINSFQLALLPIEFVDVTEQLAGDALMIIVELGNPLPAERLILESAADGIHFTPTAYPATAGADNHYRFTLPAVAAGNYYRVQMTTDGGPIYSRQLPPLGNRVYEFSSAVLINSMGQVLGNLPLRAPTSVTCWVLPASLPAGIYFIRLTAMGKAPVTVRVWKTP